MGDGIARFIMRSAALTVVVSVLAALVGCSGVAPVTPVLPATTDCDSSERPIGRHLWGLFDVLVDRSSDEPVVFTPLRSGSFHLNIRHFLEDSPCTDCLRAENFEATPDGFEVDISIRHPFNGPSHLYGFDIRGIFFLSGGQDFPLLEVSASSPLIGDAYLANADGYTTIFNPVEYAGHGIFSYTRGRMVPWWMPDPAVTLGAFRAFYSDGQSEGEGGRRAFFPGDTVTRRYEIVTPTNGPMHFGYAIDACWNSPEVMPPSGVDDFPVSANCLEPFRIDVEKISNTLTAVSGGVSLGVTAHDHQGAGSILQCRAEAPGLTGNLVIDDTPEPLGLNTVAFRCDIPNDLGSADLSGEEILLKILHGDFDPNLGMISGWSFAIADVSSVPVPPVIESVEPNQGAQDSIVDVTVRGSGFEDGATVQLYQGIVVIEGFDIEVTDPFTIECSFYLTGPVGQYTVYVENPGGLWGELAGAFSMLPPQSECSDAFHTDTLGEGKIDGFFWVQYDSAFLTEGPYAGMMLATRHTMGGNTIVAVDVDTTTPGGPVEFPDALHDIGSHTPWTIDVDEFNGNIFMSWLEESDTVNIFSSSGEPIDTVEISPQCEIRGLDHDGSGGFWVAFEDGLSAMRRVWHFVPVTDGPGFDRVEEDSFEILPEYGSIQDIAVIPGDQMYILLSGLDGTILSYDISGAAPYYSEALTNIFPDEAPVALENKTGDIEIDQVDPGDSYCRIVAYGWQQAGRSAVVKLDGALNILNQVNLDHRYRAMAINSDPDVSTRHVTLYPYECSNSTYRLLETPAGW